MQTYNYKKGIPAILACYFLWGIQSLYWNINTEIDTFFLLASRIIWASVACIILVYLQGKIEQYKQIFKNKNVLIREIIAMLFLFSDWAIYLWAVQNGKILECSLGYFIQPIVVFLFGALFFHEKLSRKYIIVIILLIIGILWAAKGFNGVPWVTISLALLFSIYAAIKKGLNLDSIVSSTCEITLMIPIALFIILMFYRGDNGLSGLDFKSFLYIMGSGIVTAAPMLLFSISLSNLSMTMNAVFAYLSPTISILCGYALGESLSHNKLIAFIFIWLAILAYSIIKIKERKNTCD